MTDERYDVVVIGAGQAGLAIGHFLGELLSRSLTIVPEQARAHRVAPKALSGMGAPGIEPGTSRV